MKKSRVLCLYVASVALAFGTEVCADEPLGPPGKVLTCSKSGAICAEADPKMNRTEVRERGGTRILWSIDGWHRWMFVADNGDSLVAASNGLNLVPSDASLKLEVLRLYDRGRLARSITLGDLYDDRSQLRATASHLAWVRSIVLNDAGQLDVELIDGRQRHFPLK